MWETRLQVNLAAHYHRTLQTAVKRRWIGQAPRTGVYHQERLTISAVACLMETAELQAGCRCTIT